MICRSDDLIAMAECEGSSLALVGQRNRSQNIAEGHAGLVEEGDEEDSNGDSLPQLDGPAGLRKRSDL